MVLFQLQQDVLRLQPSSPSELVMSISVNVSAAVGIVCEAFLYGARFPAVNSRISDHLHHHAGVYCALFIISIVILITRYRVSNRVIWVANCLLFMTSTAHFALVFTHFYIALVRNNSS